MSLEHSCFTENELISFVNTEASLMDTLASRGIPVARFLPTVDGAWVTLHCDRTVCLQEYIEGMTDNFLDVILISKAGEHCVRK